MREIAPEQLPLFFGHNILSAFHWGRGVVCSTHLQMRQRNDL